MELKDKYKFRPYNAIFPKLAEKEIERTRKVFGNMVQLEHVGSTAVPGLGGKGVIDLLMVVPKERWRDASEKLSKLGYEYKKNAGVVGERLFFQINLPDNEIGSRLYHLHLTYNGSRDHKELVGFRDYLRGHPDKAREYAGIKSKAAKAVENLATKDEMKEKYGTMKKDFIEEIVNKFFID